MPKYSVCKNTRNYNKLINSLNENNTNYEVKDCINKCIKCRFSTIIKQDDKFISAISVDKLLSKIL